MHDEPVVLMTGATGAVGSVLMAHIIEMTDWTLIPAVRAADDLAARRRVDDVLEHTMVGDVHAAHERVHPIAIDLERPLLGLSTWRLWELAQLTSHVIHLGGDVRFDRPLEQALARNVGGTARMLEFAALMPHLERFVHVSTAYVAGEVPGRVYERDCPTDAPWRNTYERSKAEAEELFTSTSLPWTILRPSIIGGSAWSGYTHTFKVFYPPLKAFAQGSLRAIWGWASSIFDVVPVDYVAAAIIAATTDPAAAGQRLHLAAGDRAITLAEFVELASDHLGRPGPTIVPPTTKVEELLASGQVSAEDVTALEFVDDAYGPYLRVGSIFDTTVASGLLARRGIRPPAPLGEYLDRVVAYAMASDWGRTRVPAREWVRTIHPLAREHSI